MCVYVRVLLTANPPDGSCDVQGLDCKSNGLIGVCVGVFFFFPLVEFEDTKLNIVM